MLRLAAVLAACALGLFPAAGCIAVPPEVEAEFTAPDGVRPDNYHACGPCARAAKAGRGKVPCPERP